MERFRCWSFVAALVEVSIDEHAVIIKLVEPIARVYEKLMGQKQAKSRGA